MLINYQGASSENTSQKLYRLAHATAAHSPPMLQLKWEDVVEYAFSSEFDLLHRTCCEDISVKPWATPAGRVALNQHFKEVQARTEIIWLNVELKLQFVTRRSVTTPLQPEMKGDSVHDGGEDEEDETDDDEEAAVGAEFMGVVSVATDRDVASNVDDAVLNM